MQVEEIVGLVVLAFSLVTGVWLAVITARFSREGSLIEAMVQTSFLREKRRLYLGFLSLEGVMVLLAGIVWGLAQLGAISALISAVTTGVLLIGAITGVGAVSWLGLRPSQLSAEQRRSLAASAPDVFHHLFLAPLVQSDEGRRG